MSYEEKFSEALYVALPEIEGEDEVGDDGIGHYEYGGAPGFDSRPYAFRVYEGRVTLTWTVEEGEDDLPGEDEGFVEYSTDQFGCVIDFTPVPTTRKVETGEDGVTRFTCEYTYKGKCDLPEDYFCDDREPDEGPDWDPDWERFYP